MTNYRWKVIALAFIAVIITYLDRSALSYAITPLEVEFGFSDADFGLIAAAFGVGYIIMTVIGGILVDNVGARKIWSLSAFLWSLACISIAFATGFSWLIISRLLLGIAEGPSFPALSRVSADWLPTSERARALALGLAAVPFASVLGAPLVSGLVTSVGWRMMFVILGALGIVWALLWYLFFRDKPGELQGISSPELVYIQDGRTPMNQLKQDVHAKTSIYSLLSNPALLVNNYAFFAFGYLLFFAITWLPGFMEQTYHIQVREAGWFLVAPWVTATLLLLLGGVISDALWKKTHSVRLARSHLIWVCQALSALCFIPVVVYQSLPVAMVGISLGIGFGMMPNAAFYAINSDLAHDRAGTSLGLMDGGFALAGILAPFITGWLASLTGSFNAALGLLIVLTFTSALAILLWQHPEQVQDN